MSSGEEYAPSKKSGSSKHKNGKSSSHSSSSSSLIKTKKSSSSSSANGNHSNGHHSSSNGKVKSEPKDHHSHSKSNGKHSSSSSSSKSKHSSSSNGKVKHEVKSESRTSVKSEPSTPNSKLTKSTSKKRLGDTPTANGSSPKKARKKKEEEEEEVWRWWEEKKYEDGRKWTNLEHKGPVFAPEYVPLPDNVPFFCNGEQMKLTVGCEEVMVFYAKMLDHEYTSKEVFNTNFMKDWRGYMSQEEKLKIKDLKKCDFTKVSEHFKAISEANKAKTKEEKKVIKDANAVKKLEYGFCMWDKHKQPIGNFNIEPPGLFRGRGEHPKMGMVKRRTQPEDVIINCGKDSKVPSPPPGHKWKKVQHDNMVAWLASWQENVQGNSKYVMLNPSSRVKGELDWQKYEKARKLHRYIDKIREGYTVDWKSKEMRIRQRAVAIYFIDKLALRAGNEKDGDEADTVGCCSLRVEHIKLYKQKEGVGEYVCELDFLGKDSIRYLNAVCVEKQVYKNLSLFKENKEPGDDLFDRLNSQTLNVYLTEQMEGLTAKVFRTYNASRTLQEQLDKVTDAKDNVNNLILSYNRANRAVAILCNHQRAVPKTFAKTMENMALKVNEKKEKITEAEKDLKKAKSDLKNLKTVAAKKTFESKTKNLERLREGLTKMQIQVTDKDENKDIALGTSKLNYLDPRISVAWSKKFDVPIEKIYSKTQREKFRWALDMATADYHFYNYDGDIELRNDVAEDQNGTQNDDTQNDDEDDEE